MDNESIMHVSMTYDVARQCWNIFKRTVDPTNYQNFEECSKAVLMRAHVCLSPFVGKSGLLGMTECGETRM